VERVSSQQDALTVADVLNRLLAETGYLRHAELRAAREGPRILFNLRKAFRMAAHFESGHERTGDFIRHLDRMVEAEVPVPEAEAASADAVRLLTIHAAKGLEFPVVFLVNLRPPRSRESERIFFDPDGAGLVLRWWRGTFHPRYKELEPAAAATALHRRERRRAVYVALTRASQALYVTASRTEAAIEDVDPEAEHDHFAEILGWARTHPESARLLAGEQLELPVLAAGPPAPPLDVEGLVARLERLGRAAAAAPPPAGGELELSFTQLHSFEVCPVRYRLEQVWRVPAPPDELLPKPARRGGSALGALVHEALRRGGDVLAAFQEAAGGYELSADELERGTGMLARYLSHPLAAAPTLGSEVEFTLRFDGVRVRGAVDRVAQADRTVLVDFKTNRTLDARLRDAYATQLRLYSLAAEQGLLPGDRSPRLVLFHLPSGEAIEVAPDPTAARARVLAAAAAIRSGDFELRPEHASRPCFLCAYRPACAHARA
jgi:ATP-dependent helicase/nuclease subunit A